MQPHLVIAFCVPSCLTDTYNSNAAFSIPFFYFKFEEYSICFFESPSAVTYTGSDVLVRGIELRC